MLEHFFFEHLIAFFEKKSFCFQNERHGFRGGTSIMAQLVHKVHEFAAVIRAGGQTDVIYFDLARKFDRVSHKKKKKNC